MTNIEENLKVIRDNLLSVKEKEDITIVAVSKKQSSQKIIEAIKNGQRIFGENYLQEALEKKELLKQYDIEWHFIGPIQSNKCKLIGENFSWIHTIDRIKVAKRLNDAREHMSPVNICVQVNISRENTKSGILIEDLNEFINELKIYKKLNLRGLMSIPSAEADDQKQTTEFELLSDTFKLLKKQNKNIDTLSLGMSNDYMKAINYGANMIRLGSTIFGARE